MQNDQVSPGAPFGRRGQTDEQVVTGTPGTAKQRFEQSPSDLLAQGVVNGLSALSSFAESGPMGPSMAAALATVEGWLAPASTATNPPPNAIFNCGSDGAKGNVNVEPGATPDANEVRAGRGLADAGFDVSHQPTASQLGIDKVRIADLSINGVGQVDVYTPETTNPSAIVRSIEKKFDQGNGVIVQADLSTADMESIAARTWGKTNGSNFNVLFFQDSSGNIVRFNRPVGGK